MNAGMAMPLLLGASYAWPDGRLTAAAVTLVRSTNGATFLVDTGAWHQRRRLQAVLDHLGVGTAELDGVIVTHLHWDHCMNFDLFTGVPLLVPAKEWDRVATRALDHATPVYIRKLLAEEARVQPFEPGSSLGVDLIETPGHTCGHMAVGIQTDEGRVVVSGDALPTRTAATSGLPHSWHGSEEDAASSVRYLLHNFDIIIPGHDAPFSANHASGILPTLGRDRW